ncbi:MAG: hypothetical protein MAG453_00149 [Calditrichaeota bacterium]|nr:hypothetical protein [Calditrichota bacterium]
MTAELFVCETRGKPRATRRARIGVSLAALLLVSALAPVSAHASVLTDRLLVLPPHIGISSDFDTERVWRELVFAYDEGVHGVEVIPPDTVIRAMGGDTLRLDLLAIGEAMDWGRRLDADAVIQCESSGAVLLVQRLDPWTGASPGPVEAETARLAVRALARDRWLYGRGLLDPPQSYRAPALPHASERLSAWLHENREYPPDALIQLVEASATVEVAVSPQGVPLEVWIISVDPPRRGFEQAAAKAIWSMRFEPARVDGRAVYGMWEETVILSPMQ